MHITRADAYLVALPFDYKSRTPALYGRRFTSFDSVLVRLETDQGLVGWGEAFAFHNGAAVRAALDALILPNVLGRSPAEHAALVQDLRYRLHLYGRTGPVAYGIAAIDIALWDLLGKEAGLPLYRLLGGSNRTHLPAYASLLRGEDVSHTARMVEQSLKRGFKAVKVHEVELDTIHTARDVLGYEIPLMVDVDCAQSPKEALEFCAGLAELEPFWLEEPIFPPENCEGVSEVRGNGGIAIAAGENAGSRYDFKHLLNAEAIDYANPSVGKIGLSETLDIIALCRVHNVPVYPHCPYLGPALLATLHLSATLGEDPWLEHLFIEPEATLYGPSARPFNGMILLPQGPGLGLEPDPAVIERYRV
jgi:L-alanine-DL-glutamate epimerase-like enolase superfamily enzyme